MEIIVRGYCDDEVKYEKIYKLEHESEIIMSLVGHLVFLLLSSKVFNLTHLEITQRKEVENADHPKADESSEPLPALR